MLITILRLLSKRSVQRKPSFETAYILNEQIEPATLHIRDKQ